MGSPATKINFENGLGMIKSDQFPRHRQAREQAKPLGTMQRPVREAIKTMPLLIRRLGPRGPSGVITT